MGNTILTDDGVGIHVARAAQARHKEKATPDEVVFGEASVGGLRLLEVIVGYDGLVLVDAIQTVDGRPGDVHLLGPGDLPSMHSGSTHDLSLSGALSLGRALQLKLPQDEAIVIVAVEVEDVLTFGEECTPAVAAAIPVAAGAVLSAVCNLS